MNPESVISPNSAILHDGNLFNFNNQFTNGVGILNKIGLKAAVVTKKLVITFIGWAAMSDILRMMTRICAGLVSDLSTNHAILVHLKHFHHD